MLLLAIGTLSINHSYSDRVSLLQTQADKIDYVSTFILMQSIQSRRLPNIFSEDNRHPGSNHRSELQLIEAPLIVLSLADVVEVWVPICFGNSCDSKQEKQV